jgi:hypothetical protein
VASQLFVALYKNKCPIAVGYTPDTFDAVAVR